MSAAVCGAEQPGGGSRGDAYRDVTNVELAAVFGRAAATYDTVIPFFATFGRRLVEAAEIGEGERVLDVAAGRGATLFPAAERVGPDGRVVGIDLAPEMVEGLSADIEARGTTNASVARMDAESLALRDASFDVLVCGFTLWLLPHPGLAAAGFLRALRPGGRCAVSMPAGKGPVDFVRPLLRRLVPRAVKPLPRPPDESLALARVLDEAGFAVVGAWERRPAS